MTDPQDLDDGITAARQCLAVRLRELRRAAGLSGEELGARCGWTQTKTSKIETGRTVPQVADVAAWASATGADETVRDELVELVEVVLTAASTWRREHRQGLRRKQQRVGRLEAAVSTIRVYQPGIIPGLLQIGEYARRVMTLANPTGQADLTEGVAARMARQEVLYDPAKRCEFVITEAALRWRPGAPELLLAQFDRLLSVSTLPNVEVGLIPQAAEATVLPHHAFLILGEPGRDEEPLVIVETMADELVIRDAEKVAVYLDRFAQYRHAAVFEEDARAVLRRIAGDLAL